MLLGSAIILMGGWLGFLRFQSPAQAFALGVAPFVPGDLIKVALAAAVLPTGWALIGRRREGREQ
jgi:biotin transport system substrate-specific component